MAEPPRAYAGRRGSAWLKAYPEDFVVEEVYQPEFSQDGEFYWLWIEKRGIDTPWLAKELAGMLEIHPKAVTWSGLKDRHALTAQWFCVHMPGKPQTNWRISGEYWTLKRVERHRKKLRIGTHRYNRFSLRLRQFDGDIEDARAIATLMSEHGLPNYFGPQRWGRQGSNLEAAYRFLVDDEALPRFKRSMALSAARAALFNQALAARVLAGNWDKALPGDILCLRDSQSVFANDEREETLSRVADCDLHPTGSMPGKAGKLVSGHLVAELEQRAMADFQSLVDGLCRKDVMAERRSLRVMPLELTVDQDGDDLLLSFQLPRGCFATSLVRELCDIRQSSGSANDVKELSM